MLKMQLRDMPEAEPHREFVTQIMPGMVERGERFTLLALVAADSDPDVGMAAVGGDVDLDYIDGEEARVVGFETDDLGEFLADGFGDA